MPLSLESRRDVMAARKKTKAASPQGVEVVPALPAPVPAVIDADGLNALHGRIANLASAEAPRVLTPHPGEAARLLEVETAKVLRDRVGTVMTLARRTGAIVVLKGAGTLVTDG